ncbi:mushroom body miniature [Musca autumnalis]|uniref:mushroom body miniature n=1 Tax=Musca autumnalis TaxID=221902 RepID=UPI003CEB06AB
MVGNRGWDNGSRRNGGGNNRGGRGKGRGRGGGNGFQKFVDVESRNEQQSWGRSRSWGYDNNYNNNQNNFVETRRTGFGGTSYLYNNKDSESNNHSKSFEKQPTIFGSVDNGQREQQQQQPHANTITNLWNNSSTPNTSINDTPSVNSNASTNKNMETEITSMEINNKLLVNIKKEKIKTERKSSSSSSSSDDSSSSEDEQPKTVTAQKQDASAKTAPSSPLNIKLKPATPTTPVVKVKKDSVPQPSSSSSSSSSEEEEEPPPTRPAPVPQPVHNDIEKSAKKSEKSKKKKSKKSKDDVVCLGQLENKVTLDDDDEDNDEQEATANESNTDDDGKAETTVNDSKSKKKSKKASKSQKEQCMLCDKEGHTSFQCLMICKNCSGPYHGYRTCPHPPNLNIMMQLFLEFCTQQLQHYQPEIQLHQWLASAANSTARDTSVPQPLVGSPNVTNTKNKTGKRKNSTKDLNTTLPKKKRKLTVKKKSNKSDDDSESTSDSDDDSTTTDSDSSSEGFQQSLATTSSATNNKKSKNKNKSNSLSTAFNMNAAFLPNAPVTFPLALNTGIPNLSNTSNQHLNNLLLTQMFQNAIGTMTKKKRS